MRHTIRTLGDLGDDVVLAPERWLAGADEGEGTPLGDLVSERRERADHDADKTREMQIVLDTSHARDGLIDITAALRAQSNPSKSAKKIACAGDLIVSRLRPYLRQIALVHPHVLEHGVGRGNTFALSTEFYVLTTKKKNESLAFLVPFLLSDRVQAILAAAQEGGHHPRVPRSSLLALRVPRALIAKRRATSTKIERMLGDVYASTARYDAALSKESLVSSLI